MSNLYIWFKVLFLTFEPLKRESLITPLRKELCMFVTMPLTGWKVTWLFPWALLMSQPLLAPPTLPSLSFQKITFSSILRIPFPLVSPYLLLFSHWSACQLFLPASLLSPLTFSFLFLFSLFSKGNCSLLFIFSLHYHSSIYPRLFFYNSLVFLPNCSSSLIILWSALPTCSTSQINITRLNKTKNL